MISRICKMFGCKQLLENEPKRCTTDDVVKLHDMDPSKERTQKFIDAMILICVQKAMDDVPSSATNFQLAHKAYRTEEEVRKLFMSHYKASGDSYVE